MKCFIRIKQHFVINTQLHRNPMKIMKHMLSLLIVVYNLYKHYKIDREQNPVEYQNLVVAHPIGFP